jgi:hypothetical protein
MSMMSWMMVAVWSSCAAAARSYMVVVVVEAAFSDIEGRMCSMKVLYKVVGQGKGYRGMPGGYYRSTTRD